VLVVPQGVIPSLRNLIARARGRRNAPAKVASNG
jgi:hypothetical protein